MVKVGIQGSTRPVGCSTLAGMAMGNDSRRRVSAIDVGGDDGSAAERGVIPSTSD